MDAGSVFKLGGRELRQRPKTTYPHFLSVDSGHFILEIEEKAKNKQKSLEEVSVSCSSWRVSNPPRKKLDGQLTLQKTGSCIPGAAGPESGCRGQRAGGGQNKSTIVGTASHKEGFMGDIHRVLKATFNQTRQCSLGNIGENLGLYTFHVHFITMILTLVERIDPCATKNNSIIIFELLRNIYKQEVTYLPTFTFPALAVNSRLKNKQLGQFSP